MIKASIVIPAFNAQKTIRACLEALEKQTVSRSEFEVIVIDDGSRDKTAEIASGFKKILLLAQKNAGPAMARNRGAKKASAEIIIFLDADCVPKKNWLVEMLEPLENPHVSGVQGRYKNASDGWMAEFVQLEIEERYERLQKSMREKGSIDFVGSYSAAYRKKIFLESGGFDEGFRRASGEDTDLSFRLSGKGHRLVFAPSAVVHHFHPASLLKYWKTKFFRAYWRVRLYEKNPQKMKKDSYTPGLFKYQMILLAIAIGWGALDFLGQLFFPKGPYLFRPFGISITAFLLVPFCTLPQSFFIFKKNASLGIASVFVFWVNAILFFAGFLLGIAKGVHK